MDKREIEAVKAEMYSKHFLKFCLKEWKRTEGKESQREAFLANCIVNMSAIANMAEKQALKP